MSEKKLMACAKLAALPSGSHNALERWAVDTVFKYAECADRQAELAATVRAQQGVVK